MKNEERDIYTIPPNFIEGGTLMGGMFKTRNVIEAGILAVLIGGPVLYLHLSLTVRIIILCLTALPLTMVALIGINGNSLSSFFIQLFSFLRNRRMLSADEPEDAPKKKSILPSWSKHKQAHQEDVEEQEQPKSRNRLHVDLKKRQVTQFKTFLEEDPVQKPLNPIADYVPIEKIEHGIIYTKDHRYIKVVEVVPVNFMLRSAQEQRGIIYSFISYLKIAPAKVQFKVLTKRADINRHIQMIRKELEQETDPHCRVLQEDYLKLIRQLGSREAVTRRFFLIFEHEEMPGTRRGHEEEEAISSLQTAARTAANYLRQCGNTVLMPENDDEAISEILYSILCRKQSNTQPFQSKIKQVLSDYIAAGRSLDAIPSNEFYAPQKIDFTHSRYMEVDGLYYAYLLVPSAGYKPQVPAGWMSLLVNAGDGIDLDMFLSKQPKDRMVRKLGQQLRINRSRIKEASDTNTDFDDLDGAIRSGYFLKDGLANNEDFYYLNLLITITADSVDELEWKCSEMKKLLLSQDMDAQACSFCEEQAFLSSLPLVSLEHRLFERSKRNVLTLGAASCYPCISYEMCDDNGILLGVNKYNNSLIIVDIFDSRIYKNANIAILGTSGAGKSFTMQLMSTRMRRRGIQVFIIAPLKGHEFHRACANMGGEFISISPASHNCINVMEIRQVDSSVDDLLDGPSIEKSQLAAKIQRLHIFFSLLIPDMSHEERQLLDDALIRTYARKGITHENSSLDDPDHPGCFREMPVLGDLYDVLRESSDTKRLANIINRLVNGSARTFNQHTNVSLENKYTVLDISELTGDLLTVGMFVALDYVWDKAKENRTVEKAIYKSELYEKTSEYLRDQGYTVRVFNLVTPSASDSWNCLSEIEGKELMAQLFCDVVIKNTGSERGDHFWDNAELNLLKALVLYVSSNYPPEKRNIGEVYQLLAMSTEKELNALFDVLPVTHPAKAPYSIFKQSSENVRGGVIIGLGSRLQVFQNQDIRNLTSHDEINLELPGKQPCAYFCITSDQDSTFDFLSSLFLSFIFIKLVRYADEHCPGGELPVPVHVLGEELCACGVIPDLSRKISVIRSRHISMSCVFQNLAGLQNRYPYNQWQEILGNCDVQLFLGCTDALTAQFISDRTGEASISVTSKAKQLGTWRISN